MKRKNKQHEYLVRPSDSDMVAVGWICGGEEDEEDGEFRTIPSEDGQIRVAITCISNTQTATLL